MTYYRRTRLETVAEALCELRYHEFQELGRVLSDLANDRSDFEPNDGALTITQEAMADLLADWAKSVEDEIVERLREERAEP
jgi:hypothetical protein